MIKIIFMGDLQHTGHSSGRHQKPHPVAVAALGQPVRQVYFPDLTYKSKMLSSTVPTFFWQQFKVILTTAALGTSLCRRMLFVLQSGMTGLILFSFFPWFFFIRSPRLFEL